MFHCALLGVSISRDFLISLVSLYAVEVVSIVVVIYFGRPPLEHIKKAFITFQTVDLEMCSI